MEEAFKIVGVLASLLALYKIIVEVIATKSTRRRDEYEFTKKFISDLGNLEVHSFALEKGFLALTGKIYGTEEIKYLLEADSPSLAINERASATGFIKFCPVERNYSWRGAYRKKFVRRHAVKWYCGWYVVTALLGMAPVFVKGTSVLGELPFLFFSISLIVLAVMCLYAAENYKTARRFMYKSSA